MFRTGNRRRVASWLGVAAVGLAIVSVGVAGIVAPRFGGTAAAQTVTPDASRQPSGIHVSGEASAVATPDIAYVSSGVQTDAGTAQDAQSRNNETMDKVIAAIKATGIADNDIKTTGLSVSPIYQSGNTISGYRATNTVRVTVNDIKQAGPVLDAAINAGANNAGNISFSIKDQTGYYQQALARAVQQARQKGDALASAMGASIVSVQSVEEESSVAAPRFEAAAPRAANVAAMAPTPVQPGELTVTAKVRVVYTFR